MISRRRQLFCRTLGGCLQESTHCYTLEVSFFSYQTSPSSQAIPYTEELCKQIAREIIRERFRPDQSCSILIDRQMQQQIPFCCLRLFLISLERCHFVHLDQQLGQNLARTFLDYYKSINYISCSPNSNLMPRLKEDRIKSRLTRQSSNMPIVNQDEATAA